jgi:hypothetical protein
VRTLPRASSKDDLDTLTTRETTHTRVGNQFGIETKVGAVRLNFLADQRTELTAGKSLLLVNVGDELGVRGENLGTWDPGVVGSHHWSPLLTLLSDVLTESERTFVLVRVLELSSGVDTDDTTLGALDLVDLVHGLLILVGDDLVGTVHGLTIFTSLETPLNVLGRSLVQVVIDMRECVLLDVGDTDVLVSVDITGGWDKFTSENVDQGRLASTVGANDCDTRAERTLEVDAGNLWLRGTWVLEGHVVDTDNGLGLGLDTLEETRLWETELHLGCTELVVRLGRGHLLDELAEVTTVAPELEALVVDNVLDDMVQELAVVRDDDRRAGRVDEVLLQPLDVLDVHVVGGLVEQKNVGRLEHGTGESELHLPATRQRGDRSLELLIDETEFPHLALDFTLGSLDTNFLQLLHGPPNDGLLGIGSVKIVLDEHSLDLVLSWETLDLLVVDGAHEGGLARTVGAEKTVTLAALEAQVRLVEQDLCTVCQVEGAVAEILALLVVFGDFLLGSGTWRGALAKTLGNWASVAVTNHGDKVRKGVVDPVDVVVVLVVDELTGNGSDEFDHGLEFLGLALVLRLEDLLDDGRDGGNVTSVRDLRNLAILDVSNTDQGVETLAGLLTSFGIGQVVVVPLESWHQLWQERSHNVRVFDKLAHVVNNDCRFTLDGSLALVETTVEERHHDGESWLVHVSDEGGGTEQVNGLRDVLRLGDTLDELGNETVDILVDDQVADLLHGAVGVFLDLWLGIPHGLGDDRDQLWHAESKLGRSALDKCLDALKAAHLLWPFLGSKDGVNDWWKDSLDSACVGGLDDGKCSRSSRLLYGGDLVADCGQGRAKEDNEVWFDVGSNGCVLSNGLNGIQSLLSYVGILLVGKLLLESVNEPGVMSAFGNLHLIRSTSATWQNSPRRANHGGENLETHFVGASCSSIGPLMKLAMFCEASVASSAVFEMVSFWRSSSRTLMDPAFSDLTFFSV